jgi:hypothetical protein
MTLPPFRFLFLLPFLLVPACAPVPPIHPPEKPAGIPKVDWLPQLRDRIPPLGHERGDRWPLVLWSDPPAADLSPEAVRMLLARGIVPHIRLDKAFIPLARILQDVGAPVIAVEGKGGNWPYSLAGDAADWAHRYPKDREVKEEWRTAPSPMILKGWRVAADRIRDTLAAFRAAGIVLDAAWLDWEVEPHTASFEAAVASPSSRALLPPGAAAHPSVFARFRLHLWMGLMSAYAAGPIREAYPKASVTNWMAVLSSFDRPVPTWTGHALPPTGPSLMTASNPTAYGVDLAFAAGWDESWPLDRDRVDRFYLNVLLRQVSADTENRRRTAPYLDSFPWVARWVRILDQEGKGDLKVPMMSRETYREALRHLWLRGIDGMQVFNSATTSDPETAIGEVEDAQAVFDEMLGFREFLEGGEVMNTDHPGPEGDRPLWSGLRLGHRALVRVHPPAGSEGRSWGIEAWPGEVFFPTFPEGGAAYILHRGGEIFRVDRTAP